jgi:type II secretory pathway predicted ATPase ExeA
MDRFHFTTPPFTRELRLEHRFKAPHMDEEVSALKRVIESRQSAALVAPAGAGKTLVLRALLGSLSEARYRTTYLKLTDISARDMCRQIAAALGVTPASQYPSLVRAIETQLRQGFIEQGKRQVIVFDEAHDLRNEFLRMIRIITNFDMDSKLVVSVILCGQPPLKDTLLMPQMEDIRQRLVYYGELRLLTREETRAYVEHRCRIAGAAKNPFDPQAVEALFEVTRGNPRAIDKLATASLLATNQAGRDIVDSSDVASARASQWM